jgi:hypothetical protein
MTVETKDLRLLKVDYGHKIKSVADRVSRLERRVEWIEKLLWLSAGAVISWLVVFVLGKI